MAWLWRTGSGASDAMVLTPTVDRWDNAVGSVYRAKKRTRPPRPSPFMCHGLALLSYTCSSIFRELDPQNDFL